MFAFTYDAVAPGQSYSMGAFHTVQQAIPEPRLDGAAVRFRQEALAARGFRERRGRIHWRCWREVSSTESGWGVTTIMTLLSITERTSDLL